MPKPPLATPHSDIDGVHRDERPNVETANDAEQGAEDLAHAKRQSTARPPRSSEKSDDDRS